MGLLIHFAMCFCWGMSVAYMFKDSKVNIVWQFIVCVIGSSLLAVINKYIGIY
jgi:uncharacterized membrane protein